MEESTVWLRSGETGALVAASLFDEITDEHLGMWDDSWLREMRMFCAGRQPGEKPEDSHWDWRRKARGWRGLLGYHSFSLLCGGELQGMLICRDLASARLQGQFGRPMVYVEFVATAPWNRPEISDPPRFRGCGRIFVLAAIQLSHDVGGKGRIGLHSLPAAETFYERKCGMTRLGPDAAHQGLAYFEMTETQADAFRRKTP